MTTFTPKRPLRNPTPSSFGELIDGKAVAVPVVTAQAAKKVILANDKETVTFTVQGNEVQTIRIAPAYRYGIKSTLTLEAGRAYYRKLLSLGYAPW